MMSKYFQIASVGFLSIGLTMAVSFAAPPKAIFLDMGDVIIQLNWAQAQKEMGLSSDLKSKLTDVKGDFREYENGLMSGEDFFRGFKKKFGLSKSVPELIGALERLNEKPVEGVEAVLDRVPADIPLYLTSNLSKDVYDYLFEPTPRYSVLKKFKKVFGSFQIHESKPRAGYFEAVLKDLNLKPAEVLFIDDREDNVQGARDVGLHAEQCIHSAVELEKIFIKYGILTSNH